MLEDRPLPKKYKLIPENASRVFSGVLFDVYQWDQKMFDGSTEKFEMIKRPDTIVVIPVINNKVILIDEEQPTKIKGLDFCAGRVEKGESVVNATLRELGEETGIVPNELYYVSSEQPQKKLDWFIHFFICEGLKKRVPIHHDSGERIDLLEVSVEELVLKGLEMELELPRELTKLLLKNQLNDFRDRFLHPSKYFERVEI
jgi:ADP-ribose pyrophosphatase